MLHLTSQVNIVLELERNFMANYEKHGAQGEMYLIRDWEESSSTHIETFDDYKLEADVDENNIVLVKYSGTKNFIKTSAGDFSQTKVRISVKELIQLIEKHGHKF
jgi:phosphomannomutase